MILHLLKNVYKQRVCEQFDGALTFGFDVYERYFLLQHDIAKKGHDGLIGLIGALIANGINDPETIRQTVTDIGGEHLDIPTQEILQDFSGEDPNIHLWHDHFAGGGLVLHR